MVRVCRHGQPALAACPGACEIRASVGTSGPACTVGAGAMRRTDMGSHDDRIDVYALIAWVLVKVVGLVMGDSRRGVRTTSSQVDTRVR
jgi:hypothetical protein